MAAEIITVDYLPASVATNELIETMLAGANAAAARVAPCLADPTGTAWATSTAYAAGDLVRIGPAQFLEVTVSGTSGATIPTVPAALGGTVTDGTATWKRVGPTPDQLAEAKLVLVGTIRRWVESGVGARQSYTVGQVSESFDTRPGSGYRLWPSEIEQLQKICQNGSAGAFSLDTAPCGSAHSPICALAFGATYCSCGADIAGFPLYEVDA